MLKLAATIFHRITGEEYKIEGFYYRNPRGLLIELSAHEASMTRDNVLVDFGDERYDTWENVNSNLYMSEKEHKSYLSTFQKWEDRDLVPNPR